MLTMMRNPEHKISTKIMQKRRIDSVNSIRLFLFVRPHTMVKPFSD